MISDVRTTTADESGRAIYGVCLRPVACWNCGFESHRKHGCFAVVSVVCCELEVWVSGRLPAQRFPTDCVCVCVVHECGVFVACVWCVVGVMCVWCLCVMCVWYV